MPPASGQPARPAAGLQDASDAAGTTGKTCAALFGEKGWKNVEKGEYSAQGAAVTGKTVAPKRWRRSHGNRRLRREAERGLPASPRAVFERNLAPLSERRRMRHRPYHCQRREANRVVRHLAREWEEGSCREERVVASSFSWQHDAAGGFLGRRWAWLVRRWRRRRTRQRGLGLLTLVELRVASSASALARRRWRRWLC